MCTIHNVTSSRTTPTRLGDLSSTLQQLMTTMPRSLDGPGSVDGIRSAADEVHSSAPRCRTPVDGSIGSRGTPAACPRSRVSPSGEVGSRKKAGW